MNLDVFFFLKDKEKKKWRKILFFRSDIGYRLKKCFCASLFMKFIVLYKAAVRIDDLVRKDVDMNLLNRVTEKYIQNCFWGKN